MNYGVGLTTSLAAFLRTTVSGILGGFPQVLPVGNGRVDVVHGVVLMVVSYAVLERRLFVQRVIRTNVRV